MTRSFERQPELRSGAASVSFNESFLRYYEEEGRPLLGSKGEIRARLLLFDEGSARTALIHADFNTWPQRVVSMARDALLAAHEELGRTTPLRFLFVATHNHQGALLPPPIKLLRKRRELYRRFIEEIQGLYRRADADLRPARLKIGQGSVDSLIANSDELDGEYDPTVTVLRAEDLEKRLIGAIVNYQRHPTVAFQWNAESSAFLYPDFPGAMEAMVQRTFGERPILYVNGAIGDIQPAVRRIPLELDDAPRSVYERRYAANRWEETERFGRVLGGEVCKLLAELEVAGEDLGARCDRWGYVELRKPASGRILENVALRFSERRVVLPRRNADLEECERRVQELEISLREVESSYSFPYAPNQKRKFLLRSDDEPLAKIMDLNARLSRWNHDLKRARNGPLAPKEVRIDVLSFNRQVCALCCSLEIHHETIQAIRARSPFPVTLMFGYVTYPAGGGGGGSYVTTPRKLQFGGRHADVYDPEAEKVFIDGSLELLQEAWSQAANSASSQE
jgi:hypothetical protein